MAPIWRGDDQDNHLHGTWEDDTLLGMGGNDFLFGGEGNDILDGGRGDDILHGGPGNNTYLFNRGDGQDRIFSMDYAGIEKHNTIRFGDDIGPNDVLARREGEHLVLWFEGSTDQITVEDYFRNEGGPLDAARPYAIEEIRFADGTSWGQAAILAKIDPVLWLGPADDVFHGGSADGGAGNDQLSGSWRDDVLLGGEGDDQLSGLGGDDVLIGGRGNDLLDGGEGSNTFEFGQQWGHDILVLQSETGGPARATTLAFDAALPGTLRVSSANGGMDLLVAMADGSASVTILGYFDPAHPYLAESVRLQFSDHSVWTGQRIRAEIDQPPGVENTGSELNDMLSGMPTNDTLAGLAGDDQLYGSGGDDLLQGGDGMDYLDGDMGNDTLQGGDGNDTLRGGQGDDTFDGGAGDDHFEVGEGNDMVLFGRASGNDRLMPWPAAGSTTVLLEQDVRPEDLEIRLDTPHEMTLRIRDSDARLTVNVFIQNPPDAEPIVHLPLTLKFADGTVWDSERLQRQWFTGDDFNNSLYGTQAGDWMDGRGGDDDLFGHGGNDTLYGREGSDHLMGDSGDDRLFGGRDGDFLFGGEGDDSLRGGQGDDRLHGESGANTYLFGAGDGNDVIHHFWGWEQQGLQTIEFDAGIDPASVTVNYVPEQGRSLKISYGVGDSILVPDYGNPDNPQQAVQVRFADGSIWNSAELERRALLGDEDHNVLDGTERADIIDGQGGDDVLIGRGGDDRLLGGDGQDYLDGGAGNNVLIGGAGNDRIYDRDGGNDVFVFNKGDGNDIISYDLHAGSGSDVIRFGEGIARADVRGHVNGSSALIKYDLNTDIMIEHFLRSDGTLQPHVDRFEFADGSSATWRELSNQAPVSGMRLPEIWASEGKALYTELPQGAFYDPDAGDSLSYKLVNYQGEVPAWLTIDPRTGALSGTPGDADSGEVSLWVVATDSMGLSAESAFHLKIADTPKPVDLTLIGSEGNDILVGNGGNDTLNGLGGNDQLDGGSGADRMAGGSGDDIYVVDHAGDLVMENGNEGMDQVNAGISSTLGLNVERLTLTGTGAINATGNGLNNVLTGNAGANILDGKAGSDTMIGGQGNDIYVVDNGADAVVEAAGGGIDHVLSLVGRGLGAHQEALTLTGTASIGGGGNELNNLVQGNSGANSLSGAAGYDILQGGGGNDNLSDSSFTGGVFDGGSGLDRLSGGNGADLFLGGTGSDQITTGAGRDIIAFNRGDGQDIVNASGGADNTVSLGRGIVYADLALSRVGTDLVLQLGQGEQIAFKSWYAGGASVGTLQVVTGSGADYQPGAKNILHDNKIEQFNFSALVARFDQARVVNPALTSWAVQSSLAQVSSGGSDIAAIGGDLTYRYAMEGDLSDIGMSAALAIVGNPQFGATAQALQPGSALNDGSPLLY